MNYTGYEQDDESSFDEDENEDLNQSKSDEEIEKEFVSYLKSSCNKEFKKAVKPSKKELANEFESEMSRELDSFIESQEKKYLSAVKGVEQEASKPEGIEQSDTDSEAEIETGVRTRKKREHFTNDELLYDPEADEKDQEWLNSQRKTSKKFLSPAPSSSKASIPKSILKPTEPVTVDTVEKLTDARTDAILNCPCCMTMLCMDCQRHEKYKTQFRAMFVFNCSINHEEQLKYTKQKAEFCKKNKKSKKLKEQESLEMDQKEEEEFDLFKPVECSKCKTEVGVFDTNEELYHFFNVLTSHS